MERRDVVFLTLDSVRADHTSVNGYERETTPELARIASSPEGAAADRCISHGNYTQSSAASILSGLSPAQHQVGGDNDALPASATTVAERFADRGYRTVGVSVNAFVSEATGLDRGFEEFLHLTRETLRSAVRPRTLVSYLLNYLDSGPGATLDSRLHTSAFFAAAIAEEHVRAAGSDERPLFLYVHFNETHSPFWPPLGTRDEFTSRGRAAARESLSATDDITGAIADDDWPSAQERQSVVDMYDAELAYTDRLVGDLFDLASAELDDPLFVVTADHGEHLGEDGLLGHRLTLTNELLHVPLVAHGFDCSFDGLVQHTDVVRTALETVGADADGVDGEDLRTASRELAVSQDWQEDFEAYLEENPQFDAARFIRGEQYAVQDDQHKLCVGEDETRLYDLSDESTDVADEEPERLEELESRFSEWKATRGATLQGEGRGEFTAAVRERLRDLGYVDERLPEET